jgi:hypothetical protein
MAIARCMVDGSTFLGISDKVAHYVVCIPQLPDLFLHRILEHALLFRDQRSLLFVVCDALIVASCPVTAPPVAPCVLAGCSAVGTSVEPFFSGSCALGPCSETATLVADDSDEAATAKNT